MMTETQYSKKVINNTELQNDWFQIGSSEEQTLTTEFSDNQEFLQKNSSV